MADVTTFSRYRLVRRIARGGMAEVYLALHRGAAGFERRVALKKILPVYVGMEEFNKLFRDEARISASMDHCGIVTVHDFGEQDGEYYIVMEYVDGPDLEEVLDRCRRRGILPPVEVVLHLGHRLASALEYAHKRTQHGLPMMIIHRDVSPPNVLIGVTGEVKLTDFGVARAALREALTRPGVLRGKYAYMSPEQVSHQPMDHRSDIFSLGTVLYETLTCINPFESSTDFQTMEAVEQARLDPAGFLRPDTPAALDNILLKCLRLDPNDRYQDAGDLRRDLGKLILDYQRADEPECLVQFLRAVFPERTRDPSLPGGEPITPPWEHLVHRLSPLLVEMPDRLPGATKSPIRLVPRPPKTLDDSRPPTDRDWPVPIVPEFMATDGTSDPGDLSDQSWNELVDESDAAGWPPAPLHPHPAAQSSDSIPRVDESWVHDRTPAEEPPRDVLDDDDDEDEDLLADPFGPVMAQPPANGPERVDNEWSEDGDPDGIQTEPQAIVPAIGVLIPRPTKKRMLKPVTAGEDEDERAAVVLEDPGFLPTPARLADPSGGGRDFPILSPRSPGRSPGLEPYNVLPPQGSLDEEDPLLRSLTVVPPQTDDGIPILNEWDLDAEAFEGPPVAPESTADAPVPIVLSNPGAHAPPETSPEQPSRALRQQHSDEEGESEDPEADITLGSVAPVEFHSAPGTPVPVPPGYEAPPEDLWRSLPDDDGSVFDQLSNEFIPAIVLPNAAELEAAAAASEEARKDRTASALWLTLAILIPLILVGAGQFVKSARAPGVVFERTDEPAEELPTTAPEAPRREALPPAGDPETPDDRDPWTEPR